MKESCVIVIPVYQSTLSALEIISLQQCGKIFSTFDIVFVKPKKLDLEQLNVKIPFSYTSISFDDSYFADVFSYSDLMLNATFYQSFLEYNYLLIYQLDAFVFKNELEHWCSLGYDYIGAPWLREVEYPKLYKRIKERIKTYLHRRYNILDKHGKPEIQRQMHNHVGNGGFSLRKVQSFYKICINQPKLVETYIGKQSGYYNEDLFWTIEVNRKKKRIKVPPYKLALKFAIETAPARALSINNNELPFGCHAWDKHLDFWRPYLQKAGYLL